MVCKGLVKEKKKKNQQKSFDIDLSMPTKTLFSWIPRWKEQIKATLGSYFKKLRMCRNLGELQQVWWKCIKFKT